MMRGLFSAAFVAVALAGGAGVAGLAAGRSAVARVSIADPQTLSAEDENAGRPPLSSVLDQLNAEAPLGLRMGPASAEPPPRLTRRALQTLAHDCAPTTPASVLLALSAVESSGRPLLISSNGRDHTVFQPVTQAQAEHTLQALEDAGANFDVGLMQLNIATLRRLNVPSRDALDPCRNLALGARVFDQGYAAAMNGRHAAIPLMAAYSTYNTGGATLGFRNGYVDRVNRRLSGGGGGDGG